MEFSTCFQKRLLGLDCWVYRSDLDALNISNSKFETRFEKFKQKRCPKITQPLTFVILPISQKPEVGFKIIEKY